MEFLFLKILSFSNLWLLKPKHIFLLSIKHCHFKGEDSCFSQVVKIIRNELLCKKNFPLDGQTSRGNSLQMVSLPSVHPFMSKPLKFTPNFLNYPIFQTIFICLGSSKSRDSTVTVLQLYMTLQVSMSEISTCTQ